METQTLFFFLKIPKHVSHRSIRNSCQLCAGDPGPPPDFFIVIWFSFRICILIYMMLVLVSIGCCFFNLRIFIFRKRNMKKGTPPLFSIIANVSNRKNTHKSSGEKGSLPTAASCPMMLCVSCQLLICLLLFLICLFSKRNQTYRTTKI